MQTTEYLTLEDLTELQTFPEPPPVVGDDGEDCIDGGPWRGYVWLAWLDDTMYFEVGITGNPYNL